MSSSRNVSVEEEAEEEEAEDEVYRPDNVALNQSSSDPDPNFFNGLLEFRVFNTALREGKVIGFYQLLSVVQDIEKGACYILFKSFKNPIICHEKDVSLEILYQGS
ncbi:hypothetical protein P8452_42663 [Trifolium repens]|nr:hypothetical protein P8452_42663 [Trifolium repens]